MRTAHSKTLTGILSALCLMSCAAFPLSGAAAAELKGYAWHCAESRQICFWQKAVVTPPKGWAEDEAWTMRYQATVLFENGDKSSEKPMMYLRAENGTSSQTLESYISDSQRYWLERVPDSSIEPLADFERKGQPSFKVFLYKNPSRQDQAFELTAFMKGADSAHPDRTYFFQIVLLSPSMKELERAKPAFYELLAKI